MRWPASIPIPTRVQIVSDPSAGEQKAFTDAYDLARKLERNYHISGAEVGRGLLVAALSMLRKNVGNTDTAKLLYEYADDYAVRDTSSKGAD